MSAVFARSRPDLGCLAGNRRARAERPSRPPTTAPTSPYGCGSERRLMAGHARMG